MLKHSRIVCLTVIVGSALVGYYAAYMRYTSSAKCISQEHCSLRTNMRKLWADHVAFTRNYLIAAIAESPEMQAAVERLLKNQDDIGNALIPYYGKDAAQKIATLLREHITIAAELLTAVKAGNIDRATSINQKWEENALAIASFLSNANPNWPEAALAKMLKAHLTLLTEGINKRLEKSWKEDIAAFDKSLEQARDMADHFTKGIVAQFPQKF